MKPIKNIPFSEIGSIPQLIKDFLNHQIPGFEVKTFSIENFRKQIEEKSNSFTSEKREILFNALSGQLKNSEISEKQKTNLELLKDKNTFTVVTGHQLNLFTGPVFFVYKILQTIKTAEFLKEKFPQQNFVPIFWLASEDHDFEEINHFKTENNFYEINGKSGGAVGRIKVEDHFFISQFKAEFKDSVYGTELIRWMEEAYQTGNTLTEATTVLVNRLFSEFGLLPVDGDAPALKAQMKEIFRKELLENKLHETSKEQVKSLTETYGKVQVNPREINLFYLTETRNRIHNQDGTYFILDTDLKFSEEEILDELETHPERFSPNALMRPVYQETVLPNLAYIGGNAEIMYWLELKDYFEEINLPFPLLIPRNSMLYIKEKNFAKLEKLGLTIDDFFGNFASVVNDKLLSESGLTDILEQNKTKVESIFAELKNESSQTDKTFRNLVEAEETRQLKSYARMHKRLLRAERIKQSETLERMENLFLEIHPGKIWQERVFNFSVFYSDFGRNWLQTCYDTVVIEESKLSIMSI